MRYVYAEYAGERATQCRIVGPYIISSWQCSFFCLRITGRISIKTSGRSDRRSIICSLCACILGDTSHITSRLYINRLSLAFPHGKPLLLGEKQK